jgi:hypothetical protein
MVAQFPHLTRLAGKLLEITGAACASACVAMLLGNLREPPHPPVAAVVRLAPADLQMIRYVGEGSSALVKQLRDESAARNAVAAARQQQPPIRAKPTE